MADKFASNNDVAYTPAGKLAAVTPSDSTDLTDLPKALWVGGSGDVSIIAADDSSAVLIKGASGVVPIRAKRVRSTGTTATDIVALY